MSVHMNPAFRYTAMVVILWLLPLLGGVSSLRSQASPSRLSMQRSLRTKSRGSNPPSNCECDLTCLKLQYSKELADTGMALQTGITSVTSWSADAIAKVKKLKEELEAAGNVASEPASSPGDCASKVDQLLSVDYSDTEKEAIKKLTEQDSFWKGKIKPSTFEPYVDKKKKTPLAKAFNQLAKAECQHGTSTSQAVPAMDVAACAASLDWLMDVQEQDRLNNEHLSKERNAESQIESDLYLAQAQMDETTEDLRVLEEKVREIESQGESQQKTLEDLVSHLGKVTKLIDHKQKALRVLAGMEISAREVLKVARNVGGRVINELRRANNAYQEYMSDLSQWYQEGKKLSKGVDPDLSNQLTQQFEDLAAACSQLTSAELQWDAEALQELRAKVRDNVCKDFGSDPATKFQGKFVSHFNSKLYAKNKIKELQVISYSVQQYTKDDLEELSFEVKEFLAEYKAFKQAFGAHSPLVHKYLVFWGQNGYFRDIIDLLAKMQDSVMNTKSETDRTTATDESDKLELDKKIAELNGAIQASEKTLQTYMQEKNIKDTKSTAIFEQLQKLKKALDHQRAEISSAQDKFIAKLKEKGSAFLSMQRQVQSLAY